MIIFYNEDTGDIIGTVEGRIHTEDQKKISIQVDNVPDSKIKKHEVPVEPVKKEVEEPVYEWRMVDEKTKKVERVQTGVKKTKKVKEYQPAGAWKDDVLMVESGKRSIYDYKIKLENGNPAGLKQLSRDRSGPVLGELDNVNQ